MLTIGQFVFHEEDNLNVEILILPYTDSISTTKILHYVHKFRNIEKIFLDLDKTLLLNNEATNGAVDLVKYIQSKPNLSFSVITNNNKYTPIEIANTLRGKGIHINVDQIRSPLVQILEYIHENNIVRAFVWGTQHAKDFLREYSCNLEDAELIIILYNNEFTYLDLCEMLTHISRINSPYVISNIDWTYPDQQIVLPDTGITQLIIEMTTGKLPKRVFGKPYSGICIDVDDPEKCLMVGDSLLTDGKLADIMCIHFFHLIDAQDLQMLHIILQTIHG